jgi:rhodanese-related sulfurtransferase
MKHSPAFLALVEAARSRIAEMTVAEYAALRASGERHVLIDIREESEWNAGHAAGAIALGKGILERDIEATVPDLDECVVLYCGGGYRSALSAEALQKMGYQRVYSLAGGWRAWREAGMETAGPEGGE